MTQDSPQVQAIRARYKASFREKSVMVEEHIAMLLQSGAVDTKKLTAIREDLHKLAGSSGMYGYDDISEVARAGMNDIDNNALVDLENRLQTLKDLLITCI